MPSVRDSMRQRPWIGWVAALGLLGLSVYLYINRTAGAPSYDPEWMKQMVTVKYTDTGETEEIPRGRLEVMLREQNKGVLDPSKGLINPKTGKPTGFIFDKREWDETITRINEERAARQGAAPPPSQPSQPPR